MLLEGKRIFIIEDNLYNRSMMQLLLEREGATIAFERWGRQTRERITKFAPVDIVLLDLMFPNNVTGFELFDNIRCMTELQNVPIVAVSAKEPDIAIPETQAAGFDGFIGKPINYLTFPTHIKSLIGGKHIWISRKNEFRLGKYEDTAK